MECFHLDEEVRKERPIRLTTPRLVSNLSRLCSRRHALSRPSMIRPFLSPSRRPSGQGWVGIDGRWRNRLQSVICSIPTFLLRAVPRTRLSGRTRVLETSRGVQWSSRNDIPFIVHQKPDIVPRVAQHHDCQIKTHLSWPEPLSGSSHQSLPASHPLVDRYIGSCWILSVYQAARGYGR